MDQKPQKGNHVICVYANGFQDIKDVLRIREALKIAIMVVKKNLSSISEILELASTMEQGDIMTGFIKARVHQFMPNDDGQYTYLGCGKWVDDARRYCRKPVGQQAQWGNDEDALVLHTGLCGDSARDMFFYRFALQVFNESGDMEATIWHAASYLFGEVAPLWGKDFQKQNSSSMFQLLDLRIHKLYYFQVDFEATGRRGGKWKFRRVSTNPLPEIQARGFREGADLSHLVNSMSQVGLCTPPRLPRHATSIIEHGSHTSIVRRIGTPCNRFGTRDVEASLLSIRANLLAQVAHLNSMLECLSCSVVNL